MSQSALAAPAKEVVEQVEDVKNNETFDGVNVVEPGTLEQLASFTQDKLSSPQSATPAKQLAVAEQDQISAMSLLEASMNNIPDSADSER